VTQIALRNASVARNVARPAGLEPATAGLEEARLPDPRRFSEENLDSEQETRERDVGRGSLLHSEGCGDQDGRPFIGLAAPEVVR